MGIGLGSFVDNGSAIASLGGVPYLPSWPPGCSPPGHADRGRGVDLAGHGRLQSGTGRYHGMYATPDLGRRASSFGHLAWVAARLTLVVARSSCVMVAVRLRRSPLGVLGSPAAVLTGLAFAAPITAFAAARRTTAASRRSSASASRRCSCSRARSSRSSSCPDHPAVAWLTPLFHGVALARGLSLGSSIRLGGRRPPGRPRRCTSWSARPVPLVHLPPRADEVAPMIAHPGPAAAAASAPRADRLVERNVMDYRRTLDRPRVGLLRAALLPARDRLRDRRAGRRRHRARRPRDPLRRLRRARRCWPRRR